MNTLESPSEVEVFEALQEFLLLMEKVKQIKVVTLLQFDG